MRFEELLRFRRDSGGCVPLPVLESLKLPMPDDVLEQFLGDHGTNAEFQRQYGGLDLHAIRWGLSTLPAGEILDCSTSLHFTEWVETVADRTRLVPGDGWGNVSLPPGAAEHWDRPGTWMRPPVMLRGELVKSDRPLHLVEGHTRAGALRGLVESGMLPESSVHRVWIGWGVPAPSDDGTWRDVLRAEHMPFLSWIMDRIGEGGEFDTLARHLIDVQHASMRRSRVRGEDLDAVLEYAKGDPVLLPRQDGIRRAHAAWERVMSL